MITAHLRFMHIWELWNRERELERERERVREREREGQDITAFVNLII